MEGVRGKQRSCYVSPPLFLWHFLVLIHILYISIYNISRYF